LIEPLSIVMVWRELKPLRRADLRRDRGLCINL